MEGHLGLTTLRKVMRLLPGTPRCKICNNPFGGFGGHICRAIGMGPSRKSPQVCAACCEKMPPGGAEIEIAVLFADIRGSTALAASLGPKTFADLLNRFYRASTDVLIQHDATIDKLIGDEIMAFFVPGFAGAAYKVSAIESGRRLLHSVGYGIKEKPWVEVGVGVEAGTAFVGNVGAGGYVDFTALGDPVNTAACLQAEARPGELLAGPTIFEAVADRYPQSTSRPVDLKGKAHLTQTFSIPI